MRKRPIAPLAITYRPLRELVPYARNARRHSPTQINKIQASLLEFGWANPMLVADGHMIAGHARLAAALALLDEGRAIPNATDPALGPTIDLSHLSAAQRRAYVLADNRLAEDAAWDLDLLRAEIDALQLSGDFDLSLAGFDAGELSTLLHGWKPDLDRIDAVAAEATDLLAVVRVRCTRAQHGAIETAIRAAVEPFAGVVVETGG